MKFYQNIYLYLIYSIYVLYIIAVFGIYNYAPKYINFIKRILKIYIGIILLVKFNPITHKKNKFSEYDRKIVFSAGVFLLLSSSIFSSLDYYLNNNLYNTRLNVF